MLDYYYIIIFIIIFIKVMFWSFYFYIRSRRIQAIRAIQQQQLQNPHRIIIVATHRHTQINSDQVPIVPNEEMPVPSGQPVMHPPTYDEAVADPYSKPPDYQQAVQGQTTASNPQAQREATPGQGQTSSYSYPTQGQTAGYPYPTQGQTAGYPYPTQGQTAGYPYPTQGQTAGYPYPTQGQTSLNRQDPWSVEQPSAPSAPSAHS